MTIDLGVIWHNLPYLSQGLLVTFRLTVVGMAGSFILGTLLALARMAESRALRWAAIIYIDVLRMVPLIMVIFWVFFLLPILTGNTMPPELAVLAALIFYNASYMAEVIRAGIEAVPRGLIEAARSSGLGYVDTMRQIVLPLALGFMLPALITRLISIFMGTSLAYVIGLPEFFRAAYNVNSHVFRPYEIFGFVAVVYFVVSWGLSLVGDRLKRRTRHSGGVQA